MVNLSLSQSQEQPSFLSCWMMVSPYCFFHSQTRSTNLVRPRACRDDLSFFNCFSTAFWVAMPAWSVPGTQQVAYPCIRLKRTRISWGVSSITCPIWRIPVTFGGGMTMEKGFLAETEAEK